MLTNHNRRLFALGLSLLASVCWAAAPEPVEQGGQTPSSTPAPADDSSEQFLLLTNGRLIRGIVTQEGSDYLVRQPIGVIPFPKKRADGVFATPQAAYKFKVDQLPEQDSDEHMKLALWCLSWKLKAEARDELAKVLVLNPKHPQAKAMLASIQQAEMTALQRRRDSQVKQTAADQPAEDRPGALDSAVILGAQRVRMIAANPVIFDLPVPTAIMRANEFYRFVHPVLQDRCVKCHDGQYQGSFQLVPIKTKVDRTPDALRANLDATLRLIDQKNPSKSELLTSTLRAHGHGAHPRPIFPGSNDRIYQILAAWANNLRSSRPGSKDAPATEPHDGVPAPPDEPFAADRERIQREPTAQPVAAQQAIPTQSPNPMAAETHETGVIPPPLRYRGNLDLGTRPVDPDPKEIEFPIPPSLNGFKTTTPARKDAAKTPPKGSPPVSPRPAGLARTTPAAGPTATKTAPKSAADVAKARVPHDPDDESDTPKKPAKPVKIDQKYLEMMLQRNIGR